MPRSDEFQLGTGSPLEGVAQVRERFARAMGISTSTPNFAGVVMPPRATRSIADAYDGLPEYDHSAAPAFRALRDEVHRQYGVMSKPRSKGGLGLDIEVAHHDPYGSYGELLQDLRENSRIKTLATSETGPHPVLSNDDNDMFRAVHDVFGHAGTGRGFDRHGEEAAYLSHARMFSPLARSALASETRGQNSFVVSRGFFGPQKVATLGQQWTGATPLRGRRAQMRDAASQARRFNVEQGANLEDPRQPR